MTRVRIDERASRRGRPTEKRASRSVKRLVKQVKSGLVLKVAASDERAPARAARKAKLASRRPAARASRQQ